MPLPQTLTRLSQSLALVGYHQTTEDGSYGLGNALSRASSGMGAMASSVAGALGKVGSGTLDTLSGNFNEGIPKVLGGVSDVVSSAGSGIGSALEDPVFSFRPIGAAFGFQVNQNRSNTRGYGINSPVEVFRIMPGPVTTEIAIDQMMLYVQDFLFSTGFVTGSGNIAFQTRPLVIQELQHIPVDVQGALQKALNSKPNDATKILARWLEQVAPAGIPVANTYINCWIKDSRISYKLEDDQAVTQSVTLDAGQVSGLSVVAGVVSGAAAQGYRNIAKSISLNVGRKLG